MGWWERAEAYPGEEMEVDLLLLFIYFYLFWGEDRICAMGGEGEGVSV